MSREAAAWCSTRPLHCSTPTVRGDARLAAALAAVLHDRHRAAVAARLAAGPPGMPLARRVADLVGLHPRLREHLPGGRRRAMLARFSFAADLSVLHALAEAAAGPGREDVQWSRLVAEDAGLLTPEPWRPLRDGLRAELEGLPAAAADRCWAEARTAWADGTADSAAVAAAATRQWRDGRFPGLLQLVGPAGSGKRAFAASAGVPVAASVDALRAELRARADSGGLVAWDAAGLSQQERGVALRAAEEASAMVTQVVFLVDGPVLRHRNAALASPVPDGAHAAQVSRYQPPYPGEAHRTWYVGADGAVADTDGSLYAERATQQPGPTLEAAALPVPCAGLPKAAPGPEAGH